jgi:hypothetical protein
MNRGSSGFWRSSLLQFLTEAAAAPILSSCQNMLTLVLSPEPGATLLGALYALCRLYVEQQRDPVVELRAISRPRAQGITWE